MPEAACATYVAVLPCSHPNGRLYVHVACPECGWADPQEHRLVVNAWQMHELQHKHDKHARHTAVERERQRVRDAVAALQAEYGSVE